MSTSPAVDPRSRGFLRAWVSRALLWSATTRSLLAAEDLGSRMLALVSMYLCLWDADRLLHGIDGSLPGDAEARADCPIPPREFRGISERYKRIRDSVMHLSDRTDGGHGWKRSVGLDHPSPTFTVAVATKGGVEDIVVTQAEIEGLLDQLDPWLRRHWERLISEAQPDQDELSQKTDTVMRSLADDGRMG